MCNAMRTASSRLLLGKMGDIRAEVRGIEANRQANALSASS